MIAKNYKVIKGTIMKKYLAFILSVIFILSAFAGCTTSGGNETDPTDTPEVTPEETPEATEPKKESLTLTSDGKCEYTVIRSSHASSTVKDASVTLKNALSEAIGGNPVSISEDFLTSNAKPGQYEILVGNTNREESKKALEGLRYHDYIISIDGSKLVINAVSDDGVIAAVKYVVELIKASEGDIVFSHEDQLFYDHEYKYDEIKIGDVSVKDYKIVYPSKAGVTAKTSAILLQSKILELCGEELDVVSDVKAAGEKEILVGQTNRAESTKVDAAALGKYGYTVFSENSKLVIVTNDSKLTLVKTLELINKEMEASGIMKEMSGKIELSTKPILTSFVFTDVHNNFAMLEPTNNRKQYVVRNNVNEMIDHLLETVGPVDVVQVGGDLISDYHSWNSSGCWPYKYFVEYRKILDDTFARLAKDGKVVYAGGNHDYAQGELSTDGPGTNGSYNSFDFYFGDVGMRQSMGELPEEDMFWEIGYHTGDKYLLAYYYEVNGIGFVGLSPDHDEIWSEQGSGFSQASLEWLDKKLDKEDPTGDKVIFVNCHYFYDHRTKIADDGTNVYANTAGYDRDSLVPVFKGHKNLYHLFGHGEIWYSDNTVRYVTHHNKSGKPVDVSGNETDSSEVIAYENRDFTSIYAGHFRPDANAYPQWFYRDKKVIGYAGLPTYGFTHLSTADTKVGQGLYIEVFEDRIVFTMKNIGTADGFSTDDIISSYTVWLYE